MPHSSSGREVSYADSHAHLDRYADDEAAAMVERARAAGVCLMLTVGTDTASSRRGLQLAQRLSGVAAAAGLHPLRVGGPGLAQELDAVAELLQGHRDAMRAVGEIGLDLHNGPVGNVRLMERAFETQLDLAAQLRLPVIVHSVGGHERTAAMLAPARARLPAVVVHYFMGDELDLRRFLDMDCYISFGRPLLRPEHGTLRTVARLVPADRLLTETDTYPLPGRTTEPCDVVDLVHMLAALWGEPVAVTASLTVTNLRHALGIGDEPKVDGNGRE